MIGWLALVGLSIVTEREQVVDCYLCLGQCCLLEPLIAFLINILYNLKERIKLMAE